MEATAKVLTAPRLVKHQRDPLIDLKLLQLGSLHAAGQAVSSLVADAEGTGDSARLRNLLALKLRLARNRTRIAEELIEMIA